MADVGVGIWVGSPRQGGTAAPTLPTGLPAGAEFWLDETGLYGDTALSTPATASGTVAGWRDHMLNGHNFLQATGANQPTFLTGGLQFGGSKTLALAAPIAITGDFTLGWGGTFAAANLQMFAGPTGNLSDLVFFNDGAAYAIDASNNLVIGTNPSTGVKAVRLTRASGTATLTINGVDAATGPMSGTFTVANLGYRPNSPHSDAGGSNRHHRAGLYLSALAGANATALDSVLVA